MSAPRGLVPEAGRQALASAPKCCSHAPGSQAEPGLQRRRCLRPLAAAAAAPAAAGGMRLLAQAQARLLSLQLPALLARAPLAVQPLLPAAAALVRLLQARLEMGLAVFRSAGQERVAVAAAGP